MLKHMAFGTLVGWVMSGLMVVTSSPAPPLAVFGSYVVGLMYWVSKHPEIKED